MNKLYVYYMNDKLIINYILIPWTVDSTVQGWDFVWKLFGIIMCVFLLGLYSLYTCIIIIIPVHNEREEGLK